MFDPNDFWCCITAGERGLIFSVLTYFFTPEQYIPASEFDTLYVVAVGSLFSNRFDYWILTFGLTFRVVTTPEGGELAVYDLDPTTWALLYAQTLSDNAACGDPCRFTSFPFELPP